MPSDPIVIEARSLAKRYSTHASPRARLNALFGREPRPLPPAPHAPAGRGEVWALRGVSFEVRRGETFGIIGRNGSGKSTLLQILAGTLAPTSGEAWVRGRVAALLELGSGFNPEFTGRENVVLYGRILGMDEAQIRQRFDDIVAFAEIGDFIEEPVKTYSSGMFLRLAFAVQAHIDASVVIVDEALAVGDVFFRQKCYARLEELRASGAAILLVSHAMTDITQYCERALLLDHGEPRFIGPATEAVKHYYLVDQHMVGLGRNSRSARDSEDSRATPGKGHPVPRPPAGAYLDISRAAQVDNGLARCVGVALTDAEGNPCTAFRQGDTAVFTYEFALSGDIGVPVCGLVLHNDRGVLVFGKSTWESDGEIDPGLGALPRIRCRQEVRLDLATGEYVFEVGLAAVTPETWRRRAWVAHEESSALVSRICHVPRAGVLSVALRMRDGIPVLTHHGVANLPGEIRIGGAEAVAQPAREASAGG